MAASVVDPNPYIGPRAFQMGERIYGREREASQLANLIIAERVVLLHSPSGAGKTSLIQAALIPKLVKSKFQVLPAVRVNLDSPNPISESAEYNRYVYSALLSLEEGLPATQQVDAGRLAGMSLSDYLSQRPGAEGGPGIQVLIFDQFEEILTLDPTDLAAKQEFFRQLGDALTAPKRWALFSMREDHVAALDPYKLPVPSRFGNTFRLDLLGEEAARQAIQQPARQSGVEFEDAAAAKLVDDLRLLRVQQPDGTLEPQLGPHVEPVQLQVVCHRLWETSRPDSQRITQQDLAAFGQVDQSLVDESLAEYYTQRVAAVAAETGIGERRIREWFDRRLITEQGARGTVLMGKERSGELANRAIQLLVDAYLVRGEKRGGATWFELSHDRLIGPVRVDNAAWFKAHLSLLQQRADVWKQQERPESLLLFGRELTQAQLWAQGHEGELLPSEADFLASSQDKAARALRLRRRNQVIVVLGAVSMLLAVLALLALRQATFQRDEAQRLARVARSGQVAAQSQVALVEFPQRSMLLAVEALSVTLKANEPRRVSAEEALRAALTDPHGLPLRSHEKGINALTFSPDRRWLASGGENSIVRLWHADRADPSAASFVLRGHEKRITALAFSPDGQWLATGSEDQSVRLWDLRAPDPSVAPIILNGQGGDVTALAFSPDGQMLATGGLDGKGRLWDMRSLSPAAIPIVLPGHEGMILTLAFSQDGHWLATGSQDRTARLWDMSPGNRGATPLVLRGHEGLISNLAFSPDGRWLATGSRDKTARLWDLTVPDPTVQPVVLRGHGDWVNALAFSPDRHWLATGSGDKTARLWDLLADDKGANPVVLHGHTSWIGSLAFSPDGHWLATGSGDKTARLWDTRAAEPSAAPILLRGHEGRVNALAFSADGEWLATGGGDPAETGTDSIIRLWAVGAPDPNANPVVLRGHQDQVNALAFSPDGHWLVTGGGDPAKDNTDNAARLWEMGVISSAANPSLLSGHDRWIQTLAFSSDGRWLATGSGDNTARLWDMRAAGLNQAGPVLRGHEGPVWALAFSPDGRWLATGSQDATARLWDLRAADPATAPRVLRGHAELVTALAFSPDGRWLATGSRDKTARLWDMRSTDPTANPIELKGHLDSVAALAFSPDGRWLATGSWDKTIHLWDLHAANPSAHPRILRGHEDWVTALAFSPNGRWLATGSRDKTARLWDMRGDNPVGQARVLRGHVGAITTLAFSRDGHWLATGSEDRTVGLWDMHILDLVADPVLLRGHEGPITTLAFSPDERSLATGSKDHTARLWLLPLDELVSMACRSAGRDFTLEEWQQFFPGEAYHKTCAQSP